MNVVTLMGRVGQDPTTKQLPSGKFVANFSIATRGTGDQPDWHNIVCWEKTAEIVAKHVGKGDSIAVEGRLQTRQWTTPAGETRRTTEVIAHRIHFGGRAQSADEQPARQRHNPQTSRPNSPPATAPDPGFFSDDDIPF